MCAVGHPLPGTFGRISPAPEQIGDGRPQLIDFGSSRRVRPGLSSTPAQSCGFTAPELLKGHARLGPGLDMWGLGCLAVETFVRVCGCIPTDKHDVIDEDEAYEQMPDSVPEPLMSLVFGLLLVRDPAESATVEEAMEHEFFEGVDWAAVRSGAVWR